MPNDAALPNVQEHAAKLQEQIATGKTAADAAAAVRSAELPQFSQGTATVDGSTPPVAGADFKETKVALPEGTETTGVVTPAPVAAPAVEPPAQAAPQNAAAAASAVAADAAAAQVQQAVEDLEDWEFEDPDLNVKIPLKFPKRYSQTVKRAFPRRADYDRLKTRWGEAAPVLEPLIADGRIRQLLPLIQQALADPTYGEYVWNGYQRVQQGLPPMVQQAVQEAARAAAAAPPAPVPGMAEEPVEDPWLQAAIAPHLQKFQTLEQKLQTFEQREVERQRQEQEQRQQQAAQAQQMMLAHEDLERYYPQSFRTTSGPNDPNWQNALRTAKDYGYIDSYGLRAGIVFGAQKWMELEAERIAATNSPAAQTLQAIDQRQVELAQRQAADSARMAAGGAPAASAPPAPMPKPSTKNPDGSLKDKDQYLREVAAWIQSQQVAS